MAGECTDSSHGLWKRKLCCSWENAARCIPQADQPENPAVQCYYTRGSPAVLIQRFGGAGEFEVRTVLKAKRMCCGITLPPRMHAVGGASESE
jgi:hypothetical protein